MRLGMPWVHPAVERATPSLADNSRTPFGVIAISPFSGAYSIALNDPRIHIHTDPPQVVTLSPGVNLVGRDPDVAIPIDHPSVSGRHCALILQQDRTILVRDMGSTNGTFLDGLQVTAAPLSPGQVLNLGDVSLTLEPPPGSPGLVPKPIEKVQPYADLHGVHAPPPSPPARASFWPLVPGAFAYAVQGDAWIILLGVTALQAVPAFLPAAAGIIGLGLGLLVLAYLLGLFTEILHATIDGEDRVPPAPDISYDWDDLRHSLTLWAAPILVAFAPAIATAWIPGVPHWGRLALAAAGCAYAPMALLGVLVSHSLGALSPGFVLRSISRAPGDYLALPLLLGLILGLELALDFVPKEILAGRFSRLALFAATSAIALYLIFVWVRLLGLFYRCHRDRLAWVLAARHEEIPL